MTTTADSAPVLVLEPPQPAPLVTPEQAVATIASANQGKAVEQQTEAERKAVER